MMVKKIALRGYPRRRRVRDERRSAERLVRHDPATVSEQRGQDAAEPRRQLGILRRVPGTDVEVRQSRGARQAPPHLRQSRAYVAEDQMRGIGNAVRVGVDRALEHEDL